MQKKLYTIFKFLSITSLSLILLLPAGCGKKEEFDPTGLVRPVKILRLEDGGVQRIFELPGQVFPLSQANMAFEVPGVMTDMLVEEGQVVEKGQLLAKLDARDYEANLNAAKATLDVASIDAERSEVLYQKEATSKQSLDIAVGNVRVAEANFEVSQKAYNDTFMRAPISGVVAKILVDDFINVQAKQEIMIIQDTTSFKAVVDIPETMGGLVTPGRSRQDIMASAKPVVYLSFFPDRGIPARMTEFSLMADPATRTYEATVRFEKPEDILVLPGMTVRVEIREPEINRLKEGVFSVPAKAVSSDEQGKAFVWIIDPDSMAVSRHPVETGNISDERMEIYSTSLSAGDMIVTSGVHVIDAGDIVREF